METVDNQQPLVEAPDEEPKPKLSKAERKQAKYAERVEQFSLDKEKYKEAKGILKERTCTDFFCLIVFAVFLLAMLFFTFTGIQNGQVSKLIAPIDMNDNFCGVENREGYPKLYFTNIAGTGFEKPSAKEIMKSGVCIEECPKDQGPLSGCHPDDQDICDQYNDDYSETWITKTAVGFCFPSLKAQEKSGSLVHEAEVAKWEMALSAMKEHGAGSLVNDMYLSSRAMYTCMALSIIWSIGYIYILSAFGECLAWAVITIIQLGLFAGSGGCFFVKLAKQKELDNYLLEQNSSTDVIKNYEDLIKSLNGGFIVFLIFALIFLLIVCCQYRNISIAVKVIDASADFLAQTKRVVGVSFLFMVITVLVVFIWVTAIMCIYSQGNIKPHDYQIREIGLSHDKDLQKKTWYTGLFMFFGLIWILNFIKDQEGFIVMVSAVSYYFDSHAEREGVADVSLAFKFCYSYHIGSIALGSFVISVVQFVRIIFVTIAEAAAEQSGENPAVMILIRCSECILKCIEEITDYITTNAYAYMAVSGNSFLSSAWEGFLLSMKHAVKFNFAKGLAGAFIFLGKVAIVALNAFTLNLIMKYVTHDLEEVDSIFAPQLVVGIITFAVATMFLNLLGESVDALLMALSVDMDMNNGAPESGPPQFHDTVAQIPDQPVKRNVDHYRAAPEANV